MKSIIHDDNAVSYSIAGMFSVILLLAVLWSGLSLAVNEMSDVHNEAVTAGEVSAQTANVYDLSVRIFQSTILFGLLGVVMWGIVQSNLSDGVQGSVSSLYGSTVLMEVLSFVSVVLVFAFGRPLDAIIRGITSSGIMDVGPDFQSSAPGHFVSIFYFVTILPAVLGILIHIISSVRKQEYQSIDYQTEAMQYNYAEFEEEWR